MNHNQFNEECPVCLDDFSSSEPSHLTSCMHRIHKECTMGLNSMKCPICQSVVLNYTVDILKSIELSSIARSKEIEDEDLTSLQNYIRAHSLIESRERMPLKQEIHTALLYARNQGIPLVFIPTRIDLLTFENQPLPPEGVVFCVILQNIMMKCLNAYENSEEVNLYEDISNDYSLEEYPFSDTEYKSIKRVITETKSSM